MIPSLNHCGLHRAMDADRVSTRYCQSNGSYVLYTPGFNGDSINLDYDKKDGSVFVTFMFCGKLVGMATIRD